MERIAKTKKDRWGEKERRCKRGIEMLTERLQKKKKKEIEKRMGEEGGERERKGEMGE